MNIVITGGLGFVGSYLSTFFLEKGAHVTAIGLRPTQNLIYHGRFRYISADTTQPGAWQNELSACDAVINLAGKSIFKRWSPTYKKQIRDSRILTTKQVVEALPENAETVLCSGSAVGYYGGRGEDVLTETQLSGDDFLAGVCRDWEAEAVKATQKGIRVVTARLGIVMGQNGGALQKMLPAFRSFVGGPIGSGMQWFSWIHLEDLASAFLYAIETPRINGPLNFCSPYPVRNRELAATLGDILNRPAFVPVPAFMIRLVMGEFGNSLLYSIRTVPDRLTRHGFEFHYPGIRNALVNLL
ncbi:MAG: TIGR01777 family oxidoreductase [Desulfobacterales bacterium]|nr:TIGR01777 family oxidoreductase [Desulfobacterales bacterium]MDD4072397.1 TIGR01777 family oxidoreductase [Desulfobacterales bacterium]MDD4393301.1 TIGR01777 family oxidoreductase [Desulfobacterales bacterium]